MTFPCNTLKIDFFSVLFNFVLLYLNIKTKNFYTIHNADSLNKDSAKMSSLVLYSIQSFLSPVVQCSFSLPIHWIQQSIKTKEEMYCLMPFYKQSNYMLTVAVIALLNAMTKSENYFSKYFTARCWQQKCTVKNVSKRIGSTETNLVTLYMLFIQQIFCEYFCFLLCKMLKVQNVTYTSNILKY